MTVAHAPHVEDDHGVSVINNYILANEQSAVCEFSDLKGRILKVTTDIKVGDVVISDGPLHIVQACTENPAWIRLEEVLSSRKFDFDALWYWTALTSFTAEDDTHCPDLPTITSEQQKKLLLLHHEVVRVF